MCIVCIILFGRTCARRVDRLIWHRHRLRIGREAEASAPVELDPQQGREGDVTRQHLQAAVQEQRPASHRIQRSTPVRLSTGLEAQANGVCPKQGMDLAARRLARGHESSQSQCNYIERSASSSRPFIRDCRTHLRPTRSTSMMAATVATMCTAPWITEIRSADDSLWFNTLPSSRQPQGCDNPIAAIRTGGMASHMRLGIPRWHHHSGHHQEPSRAILVGPRRE